MFTRLIGLSAALLLPLLRSPSRAHSLTSPGRQRLRTPQHPLPPRLPHAAPAAPRVAPPQAAAPARPAAPHVAHAATRAECCSAAPDAAAQCGATVRRSAGHATRTGCAARTRTRFACSARTRTDTRSRRGSTQRAVSSAGRATRASRPSAPAAATGVALAGRPGCSCTPQ